MLKSLLDKLPTKISSMEGVEYTKCTRHLGFNYLNYSDRTQAPGAQKYLVEYTCKGGAVPPILMWPDSDWGLAVIFEYNKTNRQAAFIEPLKAFIDKVLNNIEYRDGGNITLISSIEPEANKTTEVNR